jgi:hypothetical protein
MITKIDEKVARRCLEVIDAGLVSGMGTPELGKMCIEAAINYALGYPHGDQPKCVAPSLRKLKINLNDSEWSSDKARTAGLRRLGIAQLGSAGTLDEAEFTKRVARLAIQRSVPEAMRAAATLCKDEARKAQLIACAQMCEAEPTEANARVAYAAATAYAATAAADAAYAAYAACAAAYAAAYAACAAAYAANAAKARDTSLAGFCEAVVQILIDMKAPGCEWLWLTQEVAA